MAKRKQRRPRTATRKPTRAGRPSAGRGRAAARKTRSRAGARRAKATAKPKARKAAGRPRAKAAAAKKTTPARRKAAKRAAARSKSTRSGTARAKVLPKRPAAEHRLQLNRPRRVLEEAVAAGPPSSLDLDRHASAARSGRAELEEARREHTESSPRLTGGDVDANWASAFSTGDEAPGGDMPTPDQDVVEEIGTSLGVQYADDEELKAVDKIAERDRHRWELDPASSEDYRDRGKKK